MNKCIPLVLVLILTLGGRAVQGNKLSGDKDTIRKDTGMKDEVKVPSGGGWGKPGGQKRHKNNKQWLTIELFIVADYTIYQRWMQFHGNNGRKAVEGIKHYYAHVVEGMNDIYARALNDRPYFIDLSLNGLYIAKSEEDSVFTEDSSVKTSATNVKGTESMLKLIEWMEERKKKVDVPDFDLMVLFTRHTMGVYMGLAYPGQVCLKFGVSINRDTSFYQTVETTTHEIGHNIAAGHDGWENNCNYFHQFIMAGGRTVTDIETFQKNQFIFSKCSKKDFDGNIQSMNKNNKNCMTNSPNSKFREDFSSYLREPIGQKYTMDEQCKLFKGPESYYCGTALEGGFCWAMACYDPEFGACLNEYGAKPATGTSCGNGMWCYRTKCVTNDKAPPFKANCAYGDFKGIVREWSSTCAEKIGSHKGECYKKDVQKMCCKSCGDLMETGRRDCAFGDRYEVCDVRECRGDGYKEGCCETCKNVFVAEKKKGCSDQDKNGECGLVHSWMCRNENVRSKCCETCREFQHYKDEECKFGNVALGCVYAVRDEHGFCEGGGRSLCCQSCRERKKGNF